MVVGFGGTAVAWLFILTSGGPMPFSRGLSRGPVVATGLGVLLMVAAAVYFRGGRGAVTSRTTLLLLGAVALVTAVLYVIAGP